MTYLREYDTVRVVKLIQPDRQFEGTKSVRRPPKLGDVGIICHEYDPGNRTATVAVEMVDGDGLTIWLADFERAELESVRQD